MNKNQRPVKIKPIENNLTADAAAFNSNGYGEVGKKQLVVVLGMHRSGTSAVTRGLQVLNVDLGNTLMEAAKGNNDKGFWEDTSINSLNMEMLAALDSNWHHLAPIEPIDVEILRKKGYLLRALELLREKINNAPIFGFKDPRVAKLLPFWKEVFSRSNLEVSYVLAIRHPLSVVKSLIKRDNLHEELCYLLWLGHVITSLKESAGNKRVLVDYDRLMQFPDKELNRIANCTGQKINPTELQSYITEFIDPELRHTIYALNDLTSDNICPPIVRDIYTSLLDVASEKIKIDDLELHNKIERWSDEFERLRTPLLLIDKLLTQKAASTQALVKRNGLVASLNQGIAERDGRIASLNQGIAERDGRIASLNQGIAERDGRIASLNQGIAERDGRIARLNQGIAERDGRIARLNQGIAERDGRIARLNQGIAGRDGRIAGLNQGIVERDAYLLKLLSSKSWLITKPFRWLRRIASGVL